MSKVKKYFLLGIISIITVAMLLTYTWITNREVGLDLPEGWSYQKSELCRVNIPLPPLKDPYISQIGEYWRFQETHQTEGNPFFPNNAIAIFHNPELGGSGYVAGAVIITCKANTENDSPESFAEKYKQYFDQQNQNVPEEARITLKTGEEISKWQREVLTVHFEGGMFNAEDTFYITTDQSVIYLISNPKNSGDPFVRETSDQIFDKLKFY